MKTLMGTTLLAALSLVLVGSVDGPVSRAEGAADPGQELFLEQKCNSCHAVPGVEIESKTKSAAMKGPDLPTVALAGADRELLHQYLRREAEFAGAKHKKASKATDEELKQMLDWLVTLPAPKAE